MASKTSQRVGRNQQAGIATNMQGARKIKGIATNMQGATNTRKEGDPPE
jgi:hypothetical protein